MSTLTEEFETVGMWPTPVCVVDLSSDPDWETHNSELLRLVLERESIDEDPMTFGVMGATKTSHAIMRWDVEPVRWLKRGISSALKSVTVSVGAEMPDRSVLRTVIDGWVVVYRHAASHRLHTHHGSAWSGVYYLSTGGVSDGAGHLQFLDPRAGAIARGVSEGVGLIAPKPGRLVLFPSWLPHSVKATGGIEQERVCVAFNIGYELDSSRTDK